MNVSKIFHLLSTKSTPLKRVIGERRFLCEYSALTERLGRFKLNTLVAVG